MSNSMIVAVTNGSKAEQLCIEKEILKPWDITYVTGHCKTVAQTIALCKDATAILTTSAPLTAEVFPHLRRCRIIVRYGIGVDTIDLDAAAVHRIPVVNIPDYGVDVVADHTVGLLLGAVRKIPQMVSHVKQGSWSYPGLSPIMELQGKVLGLAGFGNIARAVARRMRAFDMQVLAHDPYVEDEQFTQLGVQKVDQEELLRQSDILSIHLPLTAKTKHWLDWEALQKMKTHAYVINTARGGVVNTEDLAQALREGIIAGAGLDVLEQEPITDDHPLLPLQQCIITSHCASYSVESHRRLHDYAAQELARLFRGERPKHIVNGVEPESIPVPIKVREA